MKTSKKYYLTPIVDNQPIAAMHCLCGSEAPTADIQYSEQGAGESGQTYPF